MSYSNPHDPWETDPSPSLTRGKWVTHMSYLEWLDLWRALDDMAEVKFLLKCRQLVGVGA